MTILLLCLILALLICDVIHTRRWTRQMEEANRLTRETLEAMGYKP